MPQLHAKQRRGRRLLRRAVRRKTCHHSLLPPCNVQGGTPEAITACTLHGWTRSPARAKCRAVRRRPAITACWHLAAAGREKVWAVRERYAGDLPPSRHHSQKNLPHAARVQGGSQSCSERYAGDLLPTRHHSLSSPPDPFVTSFSPKGTRFGISSTRRGPELEPKATECQKTQTGFRRPQKTEKP